MTVGAETSRWTRIAWGLLAAWFAMVGVGSLRLDQAIFSDPGWGLLAAEQWRQGLSPGLRVLVSADPRGLAGAVPQTLSWWPPAYQAVPLVIRQLTDASWGTAVRTTVWLAWLGALAGWGLYFRLVAPRARTFAWLLLIFATSRFAHAGFDKYDGGGNLILAAFPWVLLLNVHALARASIVLAALAGAAGAGLLVVKYSALVPCVALGAAWLGSSLGRPARRGLLRPAAYALGAVAVYLALRALGIPGGPTPGDAAPGAVAPARLLYPFTMLPLALTDLDSLVHFLFVHPSRPWLSPFAKWAIGAPLLAGLLALLLRQRRNLAAVTLDDPLRSAASRCAVALVVVTPLIVGVLLARGGAIDDSARHVRLAGLAALPWVVTGLFAGLRSAALGHRAACALALAALVALPCAYGATTFVDKAFVRAWGAEVVGTTSLRQDLVGPHGRTRAFMRAVGAARPSPDTVVYVTSPDLALELADARLIVRHADRLPRETLAGERFAGCPRGGVLALLPRTFETNGKLDAIRDSFVDVPAWRELPLPGSDRLRVFQGSCASR